VVGQGGGYSSGSLIASDEMELIYTEESETFYIGIDSLKQV